MVFTICQVAQMRGAQAGRRGVVSKAESGYRGFAVEFQDGTTADELRKEDLASSGLTKAAFDELCAIFAHWWEPPDVDPRGLNPLRAAVLALCPEVL